MKKQQMKIEQERRQQEQKEEEERAKAKKNQLLVPKLPPKANPLGGLPSLSSIGTPANTKKTVKKGLFDD